MNEIKPFGVYGVPAQDLLELPREYMQFSPLLPGSHDMGQCAAQSLASLVVMAPPGTAERRHVLAQAIVATAIGAEISVLAPKDKGGSRIGAELKALGCEVQEGFRRHHRICVLARPQNPMDLEQALAAGALQLVDPPGFWSQPGIFSWNRIDPGSALLAQHLPALVGTGADFGCGIGFLARKALASDKVKRLYLLDIDRRAVDAAKRNVLDPRAEFLWVDVRRLDGKFPALDFIVMNPPFHDAGHEDQGLGLEFIIQAAAKLRKGGTLWLTANRHLPYEALLAKLFQHVRPIADAAGFKLFEARK